MNKKQAKKKYNCKGTKRLRKQWQKAIDKGKVPNKHKYLSSYSKIILNLIINECNQKNSFR